MNYFKSLLLFCIILYVQGSNVTLTEDNDEKPQYKITPINQTSGLYFERLGSVQVERERHLLVFGLETSALKNHSNSLRIVHDKIQTLCNSMGDKCASASLLKDINERLTKTDEDYENIFRDVSVKNERKKRYIDDLPFDPVRMVYGVMGSDVRTDIYREINAIRSKTVNMLKESSKMLNIYKTQFKAINDGLKQFEESANALMQRINKNDKTIELTNLVLELNSHVIDYELDVDTLLNAIKFAQIGQIHPKFINIPDIKKNIESLHSVDGDSIFPFPKDYTVLANLHSYFKMDIFLMAFDESSEYIAYTLTIPLVDKTTYTLYRPWPFPFKQNSSEFSFAKMKPKHNYVAIAQNGDYFPMTKEDISECKHFSGKYVCSDVNMIYSSSKLAECEVQLLTKNYLDNSCMYYTDLKNDSLYVKSLESKNEWLYVAPTDKNMILNCRDDNDDQIKHYVTISGRGILKLNETCIGRIEDVVLIPEARKNVSFSVDTDITAKLNVSDIFYSNADKGWQLNVTEAFEAMKMNSIIRRKGIDELENISYEYSKLDEELDDILNSLQMEYSVSYFEKICQICAYISTAVCTLATIYYITSACKGKINVKDQGMIREIYVMGNDASKKMKTKTFNCGK